MDGIIIINKEKDYTSNDVVQIVKKMFKEKVGHTGTLDPMATGVLPILVGKGTQLSKYLINHDKIYTATVKLGIKTDTGDITGNVIEEKEVSEICYDKENVQNALKKIVGEQQQIPPMYSAIKVKGKKLYEYARKGQKVEIEPRTIKIYSIELISILKETQEIQFRVSCSKGTYIRTLCESFANILGTVGTMSALNREKVGEFDINKSVKIDDLRQNFKEKNFLLNHIISIGDFLENNKSIQLSSRSFMAFINGVKIHSDEEDGLYKIYDINGVFLGTGIVNKGILKRDIVI